MDDRYVCVLLPRKNTAGAGLVVVLPCDDDGDLPPLLSDPVDWNGRVASGTWLLYSQDDSAREAAYLLMLTTGYAPASGSTSA